jgi:hypothetical protein
MPVTRGVQLPLSAIVVCRSESRTSGGRPTEATRRDGTVSHIKYTVFTYSGDEITSGGAPHDFDGPLESEQEVIYGDDEWIVDHVDEEPDPPAVWLRPVSEGDLPV